MRSKENNGHLIQATPCGYAGGSGKEFACNAGDTGDTDSIPGSGRSPGEGMATHSRILAWKIPCTEKPCRLQFMGSQRVRGRSTHKIEAHVWRMHAEGREIFLLVPNQIAHWERQLIQPLWKPI